MLDSYLTFTETADPDDEIWWGAYVGTADEILISGPRRRRGGGDRRNPVQGAGINRLVDGCVSAAQEYAVTRSRRVRRMSSRSSLRQMTKSGMYGYGWL